MCVIEAMAYGVPVVSTRVGAVSEAVEDGVSGILVKPYDAEGLRLALCGALSDRKKRIRMSEASYRTVCERYSLDAHVANLLHVYEEVVKEGSNNGTC